MVIRAGEALRAGAVMLGGPTALAAAALASGLGSLRAIREGRRPSPIALGGLAGLAVYLGAVRPWMRNWGATEDEATGSLPGDEDLSDPAGQTTRAVTIGAPAADIWPWIAQMGQDRGGFYSYEWLEVLWCSNRSPGGERASSSAVGAAGTLRSLSTTISSSSCRIS